MVARPLFVLFQINHTSFGGGVCRYIETADIFNIDPVYSGVIEKRINYYHRQSFPGAQKYYRIMVKKYKYRKKITYQGVTFDARANTAEELGEKIAKKKFEIDHALSTTGGATPVSKWVEHYFDIYVGDSIAVDTRKDRENMYKKHIRPYIGALPIRSVTAGQCQQIINRMEGYSKDRVNKLDQLLFNIFDKARKERLIVLNPAADLEKIPAEDGRGRAATMQERALMLLCAPEHRAGLWLRTILYCGFRPGETDLFKGKHINYDAGLVYIDGTKSRAAKRIVPAPADLLEDFKTLNLRPEEYVFKNAHGDRLRKSSRDNMWHSFKRAMDITAGCNVYRNAVVNPKVAEDLVPYCFRHSFATDLKDANVPFRIRQELLGHADSTVTDRYTHRTEESLDTARKLLETFRAEQDEKIKAIQQDILAGGYQKNEVTEDDLAHKFFPDL